MQLRGMQDCPGTNYNELLKQAQTALYWSQINIDISFPDVLHAILRNQQHLKSKHKKKYRSEHASEITAYEEARDWLKDFYPDGKMLSLKSLRSRKEKLQDMIHSQKMILQDLKCHCKELDTVSYNTDAILTRRAMEMEQTPKHLTTHHKSQKERNEEIL